MYRPAFIILIVADALVPNKHQAICKQHCDFTVNMRHEELYAIKYRVTDIREVGNLMFALVNAEDPI